MTTSKAIIIAAAILAGAILASTRFDRTAGGGTYFVVHDRWTGRITRCYETTETPAWHRTSELRIIGPVGTVPNLNRWYCDASPTLGPVPALWRW